MTGSAVARWIGVGVAGLVLLGLAGCEDGGSGGGADAPPVTTLDELVASVSTPQALQSWMRENIRYGWPGYPDQDEWTYLSPQQVFDLREGDCTSQSSFEARVLEARGYDCHLLWIQRDGHTCHAVCYWPEADGLHYLENAFEVNRGIYGPFATPQEIGRFVYDQLVAWDGEDVGYSLHTYDDTPFGLDFDDFLDELERLR